MAVMKCFMNEVVLKVGRLFIQRGRGRGNQKKFLSESSPGHSARLGATKIEQALQYPWPVLRPEQCQSFDL